MITAIFIAGTVWAIIDGVRIYNKSNNYYGTVTPVTINGKPSTGTVTLMEKPKT